MFNTDSCFKIGYSHKICQDYSSHFNGENPFVIIADGCSSVKDSDFGSRILTKLLEKSLIDKKCVNFLDLIKSASDLTSNLNLDVNCLCSTLIHCIVKDDFFNVLGIGDYTIFLKRKNGDTTIVDYEFPSGAPYYLKYELSDENKKIYFEKFGSTVIRKEYNNFQLIETKNFNIEQFHFEDKFSINEYSFVSILSDGIKSFIKAVATETSKYNVELNFMEPLNELMSYKIFGHDFVLKRTAKAFQTFNRFGIQNFDDISIGTISSI